jgi:hypothetical protein
MATRGSERSGRRMRRCVRLVAVGNRRRTAGNGGSRQHAIVGGRLTEHAIASARGVRKDVTADGSWRAAATGGEGVVGSSSGSSGCVTLAQRQPPRAKRCGDVGGGVHAHASDDAFGGDGLEAVLQHGGVAALHGHRHRVEQALCRSYRQGD